LTRALERAIRRLGLMTAHPLSTMAATPPCG
jgi:hypothetical protein